MTWGPPEGGPHSNGGWVTMTTRAADLEFGPFAHDRSASIPISRLALALGIVAAFIAGARPVVEAISPSTDLGWSRIPGVIVGTVALVVALVAFYFVSTEGRHGRTLALAGLALAFGGGITSIVYGAIADHTLRLGRFFHLYFDGHLLRTIAPDLARGAVNTIKAAFLAEVIAVVVGLVVATFRLAQRKIVRAPAIVYINVLRGLPLVVLAALVTYGLPAVGITLGTLAAVVTTLVLNASAYIAEIFRAGIQSLPRGQTDAARSLGMTRGAAMTSVVIPQAFRAVIPPLMNEFVALIKDTALVYIIVGVTVSTRDMYTAAQQFTSSTFSPTPLIGASIGYLIITIPLAWLVGRVERRLRAGLM